MSKKRIIFVASRFMEKEELYEFERRCLLEKKFVLISSDISYLEKDDNNVIIKIEMEW